MQLREELEVVGHGTIVNQPRIAVDAL
jgi:hypothetical protein